MRLNLYWRGRDVIDVEMHLWRKREDDEPEIPKLTAAASLQDFTRAEPSEPDTKTFGFSQRPEASA